MAAKVKAKASRPKARLLAGGNPQIAKGEGDAPVRDYIAAIRAGSALSGSASTR